MRRIGYAVVFLFVCEAASGNGKDNVDVAGSAGKLRNRDCERTFLRIVKVLRKSDDSG